MQKPHNKLARRAIIWLLCASALLAEALPASAQNVGTGLFAPLATYSFYLPRVMKANNPTADLTVPAIEFTQASQTDSNSVPMVAGRSTVVRVYTAKTTTNAVGNIYISLSATRGGVELAGSPMLVGPGSIPSSWSRSVLSSSFNFQLPQDWLSGNVTLVATVDATGNYAETNEGNNTRSTNIAFNSVPALNVTVVPVNYTHTPQNRVYPPPPISYIQPSLYEMYPVSTINITAHPPINFTGDLLNNDNDWNTLLNRVSNLKDSENKPDSEVYYGAIPLRDAQGRTWFTGGIAGLGWLGYRASIGLSDQMASSGVDGGEIVNHEIGHNLGRYHSPSPNNGICQRPAGIDGNYPYANGVIGQIGLNVLSWLLYPTSAYDIMGYCDNPWISDYTYKGLYNDQRAKGMAASLPSQESLLVRINFDGQGTPIMQPLYSFPAVPTIMDGTSEYAIEMVGLEGQVVASYPVQMLVAEDYGITMRSIRALLPRPPEGLSTIRLVRSGATILEKHVLPPISMEPASTISAQPSQDLSEWVLNWDFKDTPVMIRVSTDRGSTWNTLGMDLLGGELRLAAGDFTGGQFIFQIFLADSFQFFQIEE